MADIFISYVHEDRSEIRKLVDALKHMGWSVWWDPQLLPGEHYDRVIERELDAAKCIIVVWSKTSLTSDNVRNEAVVARTRGCLIQVTLDGASWPSTFAGWQAVDLRRWTGELGDRRFRDLCGGIQRLTGSPRVLDLLKKCLGADNYVVKAMLDQRDALSDAHKKSLEHFVGDPSTPTQFRAILKVLLTAAAEVEETHVQVCCLIEPSNTVLSLLNVCLNGGALVIKKQEDSITFLPKFVCKSLLGDAERLAQYLKEEKTVGDLLSRAHKQLPGK